VQRKGQAREFAELIGEKAEDEERSHECQEKPEQLPRAELHKELCNRRIAVRSSEQRSDEQQQADVKHAELECEPEPPDEW